MQKNRSENNHSGLNTRKDSTITTNKKGCNGKSYKKHDIKAHIGLQHSQQSLAQSGTPFSQKSQENNYTKALFYIQYNFKCFKKKLANAE